MSDEGGSAFPIPPVVLGEDEEVADPGTTGMTLRDYIAAKVVVVLVARPHVTYSVPGLLDIARISYKVADAMLVVRSNPKIAAHHAAVFHAELEENDSPERGT